MQQNRLRSRRLLSRKWIWFIALLVSLVGSYLVASRTRWLPAFWRIPAPHPAPEATRDARWRQDLRYLARELPRLHVNAFHSVSQAEFARAVAELDAAIPTSDDRQVIVRFVQLAAMLGDAHTRAFPVDDAEFTLSPLQLYWFHDGIHVVNAMPEYREALYVRVVEVEGIPVQDAVAALTALVAHENEAGLKQRVTLYLVSPNLLHTLGLTSAHITGHWLLERADGSRFALQAPPIPPADYTAYFGDPANAARPAQLPLYRKNQEDNYWFEYLEATRTLYFQFNRCAEMEGLPFKAFNKEMFVFVDAHPVERLVVDMRDNSGGNSSLLAPFLARLKVHPLNRRGALFVVVGRGTFSSAVLNALELVQETEAIFVGEPTSGSLAHYGEVQSFVLPNSGMRVNYSTKYFSTSLFGMSHMTVGDVLGACGYTLSLFPVSASPATTFEPEIHIAPTGADYAAGRDPVLEYILDIGGTD
jgi:hypothetical protein